jgi:hypothetical protein
VELEHLKMKTRLTNEKFAEYGHHELVIVLRTNNGKILEFLSEE